MGIYIFDYQALKKYLIDDERDPESSNDFGKNIIPTMLANGEKMVSYRFEGYWKDVGTIQSLWEANMDLIDTPPKFDINDRKWSIYSRSMALAPHYVGKNATIKNSTITEGCMIDGTVEHSVIFSGVTIGEGSVIKDSVIMPGTVIGKNVTLEKVVIGSNAVIEDGVTAGISEKEDNKYASKMCTHGIVLIEGTATVPMGEDIPKGSMIEA
jgi:glucose-1-phosphate adenylyltransferase